MTYSPSNAAGTIPWRTQDLAKACCRRIRTVAPHETCSCSRNTLTRDLQEVLPACRIKLPPEDPHYCSGPEEPLEDGSEPGMGVARVFLSDENWMFTY